MIEHSKGDLHIQSFVSFVFFVSKKVFFAP
jgi:hypothetical protein